MDGDGLIDPTKRPGAWLTDLSDEDLTYLFAGLAYVELYSHVDVRELRLKILDARARLRRETEASRQERSR